MAGLVWKGTRADLVATLRRFAAAAAGVGPAAGTQRVVRAVLTRGAVALLTQIHLAFVAKARGGTGSDGIKWPPLSPKTIARRRSSRKERKALGLGGRRYRGNLTPAENRRWKEVHGKALAGFRARGVEDAAVRAQAFAWQVVKAEGAKTKAEVLGGRNVEILRDTSALLRSLTPGHEDAPAGKAGVGQVLEVRPGLVAVGSNLPYALAQHRGRANRNPARRLWPANGIPDAWAAAMSAAVIRGLVLAVTRMGAAKGERV